MMTTTESSPAAFTTCRALFSGLLAGRLQTAYGRDYCTTRQERTAKSWGIEGELYGDGSGFEVAFRGRLLAVGF